MSIHYLHVDASNLAILCVDAPFGAGRPVGRLYDRYHGEPTPFYSIHDLLFSLEELFDSLGYPQASTTLRRMGGEQKQKRPRGVPERVNSTTRLLEQQGSLATFLIHVHARQGATWQGVLEWKEKKKVRKFFSTLELITLLDNALPAVDQTAVADNDETGGNEDEM